MRYFFIVGCGRSGTTLLQAMLMSARGVYIPPETKFLGVTWHHRRWIGDITSDAGWTRALAAIDRVIVSDEMKLDRAAFRAAVNEGPRSYPALFRAWLHALADAQGVEHIGEKSPVHTPYALELLAMFPEARIVNIIRDPRDVAVSQFEAWRTPALRVALRWRRDVSHHETYRRVIDPTRYRSVRYEDLVTRPRAVIEPLCEFLGLEFAEAMLHPQRREKTGFAPRETHKLRTLKPVTAARVGRFREKLSPADVAVIEAICGELMERQGYPLTGASRARGAARAAAQVPIFLVDQVRHRLGIWRRARADA